MNHEQKKQQTERVNERNKKRIRVKVKVRVRDKMKTPEERKKEKQKFIREGERESTGNNNEKIESYIVRQKKKARK